MAHSKNEPYLPALNKAYQDIQRLDPFKVAYLAACEFHPEGAGGHFVLRYWNIDHRIEIPHVNVQAIHGQEPDVTTSLLLLHYLIHADGTPPADAWISFRELPDGRVYDLAFQRRASQRLASTFGGDAAGLHAASRSLGGERLSFGDASYRFQLLPRLAMAVILHLGNEEFGPAVSVLFDGASGHYLPTEDLAVLGGVLAGRLIKKA
jgi:hypothetical protein